ncbi:MAG: hypothetical protein J6T26_04815 [Firmicutes bacterium]|nr:hypothetical protein [Bacillota bacterium]
MADISKIVLPGGGTYDLKDAGARSAIPAAYASNPAMDGTASAGSSGNYARGDHVHPTDVSRAPVYGLGKNLLDNWYFLDPVNQRGASSYTANGYCIDRWYLKWAQSLEMTSTGIKFTAQSNSVTQIVQEVGTGKVDEFQGKDVVFSVLVSSITGTGRISIAQGTSISNNETTLKATDITGAGVYSISWRVNATAGYRLNWILQASAGAVMTLAAAKLEIGKEQTLAHQENGVWVLNEIPDYGEELRKCQRYLLVLSPLTDNYGFIGFASGNPNAGGATVILNTPVTMRKGTPSIQRSGDWRLFDRTGGATFSSVTAISKPRLTQNAVAFVAEITGAVAGRLYEMASYDDASAQLIISVEL